MIENAAGASGGGRIGTEHLLLGLLREGGAMGTQVLRSSGADLRQLQAALDRRPGSPPVCGGKNSGRAAPSREELPRSKLLEQFTRSLTALAREGRLDPVVGREGEIGRAVRILSRRTKNNPVLIGEPGVGKTAVAEGLAQRIVAGEVPEELRGMTILSIDMAAMLAGTK